MTRLLAFFVLPLFAATACGPLIELEEENIELQTKVDSLEIALTECHAGTDLAHERLAAIERENLQLDDKNRQLQARLTEVQFASTTQSPAQNTPPAQSATPAQPAAPAPPAAPAQSAPPVRPVITPTVPPAPAAKPSMPAQPAAPAQTGIARSTSPAPEFRQGVNADLAFLRGYQSALSAYNSGEYRRAAREFAAIMMTSRPNTMIDNCVYWLGESHRQLGENGEAIARFSTVIGYTGSDKISAALLSRGRLYMDAGQSDMARADLQRITRDYPQSEQSGSARQLLQKLR